MGENLNGNDALVARVQQLENERDELHKDIEQLCLQNSGPGYLAAATRMHFQRTAALEQDIEHLKMKLASCMRENTNLREELSEAYQIKSQLADLHSAEVSKNMEAEKQVNFFQNCVAAAFAERDQSIIEAEKAKEKLDIMKQKLNDWEKRAEKLNNEFLEEKKISVAVFSELEKQEKLNENFKKVVNKFYEIRQQHITSDLNGISWEDKCDCLLKDTEDTWSFNDYSTPTYIVANEKVKALMELAQLKQDYHRLQEKLSQEVKQGNVLADNGEIKSVQDRDGRLRNIFKKTYLKRWINPDDTSGNEVGTDLNQEGNTSKRISNHSMDFARMKVENAALMESLESMHHLTSSVHRLRFALLKVRDSIFSMKAVTSSIEAISNIMYEAKLLKTALGSSLPVSWSVDTVRFSASHSDKAADVHEKSRDEKVDCVSAAGHEMVELVILASQILLDEITIRDYNNALSSQESSAA